MARVILTGSLRDLAVAAGAADGRVIEVEARNVRELLHALEDRLPGIGARVEAGLSIAIDGDILSDPLLEPIAPDSEIHFLPAVQGGR